MVDAAVLLGEVEAPVGGEVGVVLLCGELRPVILTGEESCHSVRSARKGRMNQHRHP